MKALLSALLLASLTVPAFGLAEEHLGPDSARSHPTSEQGGWAPGIIELFRHEARVYSVWVNGGEYVYFKADHTELQELVTHFANSRMRDHHIIISPETPAVSAFDKTKIAYNIKLEVLSGIALHFTRDKGGAETHEPTLTIYVDPATAVERLNGLKVPEHVILTNKLKDSPIKTSAVKPERKLWHAEMRFDNDTPAVDFESGVSTILTYWEKESERGIEIGAVDHEGFFNAPFSEAEMEGLAQGDSWITITIGNFITKPAKSHPRLPINVLTTDKKGVKPYSIKKPGLHFGRILFEDGSPAFLDGEPWPGAQIMVSFPYGGPANPDKLGYFQLFFAPDQLKALKKQKERANIYVPLVGEKNHSRALHIFPVSKLSLDKESAGVVKIPRPTQEKEK